MRLFYIFFFFLPSNANIRQRLPHLSREMIESEEVRNLVYKNRNLNYNFSQDASLLEYIVSYSPFKEIIPSLSLFLRIILNILRTHVRIIKIIVSSINYDYPSAPIKQFLSFFPG